MNEIEFVFNNNSYICYEYSIGSHQATNVGNAHGRPMMIPIVLQLGFKNDPALAKWAFSQNTRHDATINLKQGGNIVSQWSLKDAIATSYAQEGNFSPGENGGITESVTLLVRSLEWTVEGTTASIGEEDA